MIVCEVACACRHPLKIERPRAYTGAVEFVSTWPEYMAERAKETPELAGKVLGLGDASAGGMGLASLSSLGAGGSGLLRSNPATKAACVHTPSPSQCASRNAVERLHSR